jgi:hypothetical protein
MNVLVFVTDDGSENGTGPILFLTESGRAALPPNPRSFPWRYFATVSSDDGLIEPEAQQALSVDSSFISHRLLSLA